MVASICCVVFSNMCSPRCAYLFLQWVSRWSLRPHVHLCPGTYPRAYSCRWALCGLLEYVCGSSQPEMSGDFLSAFLSFSHFSQCLVRAGSLPILNPDHHFQQGKLSWGGPKAGMPPSHQTYPVQGRFSWVNPSQVSSPFGHFPVTWNGCFDKVVQFYTHFCDRYSLSWSHCHDWKVSLGTLAPRTQSPCRKEA